MFFWRYGTSADIRKELQWLLGKKYISKLLMLAKVVFIPIVSLGCVFAKFLTQIFVFRVLFFKGKCFYSVQFSQVYCIENPLLLPAQHV